MPTVPNPTARKGFPHPMSDSALTKLLSFLFVLVALSMYFALVITGHDGSDLINKAITLAAIGGLGTYTAAKFSEIGNRINENGGKLDELGNGKMDKKIRENVRAVLDERTSTKRNDGAAKPDDETL